jgi:tRNA-splicing ligase RtcB
VRAREADFGIVPSSMGARSFVVREQGNPASFYTGSNDVDRVMSRIGAIRT